jgi:hypothetical protein
LLVVFVVQEILGGQGGIPPWPRGYRWPPTVRK